MNPKELFKRDGYTFAFTVGEWGTQFGPLVIRSEDGRVLIATFTLGWVSFVFTARDQEKVFLEGLEKRVTRTRCPWVGVLRNENVE